MRHLGPISSVIDAYRREGLGYVAKSAVKKGASAVLRRTDRYRGESALESGWDLLVVLDACRPDALEEVAPEFEFVTRPIPTKYSVGSCSTTWLERTFADEYEIEIARSAYVSANPHTEECLSPDRFQCLEEVWKTEYDAELGTIPPGPVTDRAIGVGREQDPDRLIVHYMQPHFPSIPDPLGFGIRMAAPDPDDQKWVWSDRKPEGLSRATLWDAYVENLRYVLEEVAVLLENVDADTAVITADHGNAFGEWGMWGHPGGEPFPVLREVPWVETSARDTGSRLPTGSEGEGEHSVEETLRALGYTE